MAFKATTGQALSLREAGEYDARTKQKEKLTGWGAVSKQRQATGVSRKEQRKLRAAQGVN